MLYATESQYKYVVYLIPGNDYQIFGELNIGERENVTVTISQFGVNGETVQTDRYNVVLASDPPGTYDIYCPFTATTITVGAYILIEAAVDIYAEMNIAGPPGVTVELKSPITRYLTAHNQSGGVLAYLENAYAVKIKDVLNGGTTLQFKYPLSDEKVNSLIDENIISYDGQQYVIKRITDNSMERYRDVYAEHIAMGLIDYWQHQELNLEGVSAYYFLNSIVNDTPYSLSTVEDLGTKNIAIGSINKLEAVFKATEVWAGELEWDNTEISFKSQIGHDNGVQFRRGKNIVEIARTVDTRNLVTKLWGYGKDDLTIVGLDTAEMSEEEKQGLTINEEGLVTQPYITSTHDTSYYRAHEGEYRNADIETKTDLLTAMRISLEERETPKITYEAKVIDLSSQAEYVGEGFGKGDTVRVIDEVLGIAVTARVVEIIKWPMEPWKNEVVLANFIEGIDSYMLQLEEMKKTYNKVFTKGKLSTQWLEGIINVLQNMVQASGSYASAEVLDNKGLLLENTNAASSDYGALYLGPGIFAIANEKLPTGAWDWRTFGTGKGFTADCVVAGKILTSLVQIVGESNAFYWDGTGLYAKDPEDETRYMQLTKEGLKGYSGGSLRMHIGPYAANKYGILLKSKDGTITILDEDGILQTWQEGDADNVDSSNPLTLNVYLPEYTRTVVKAILRFKVLPFRAYSKGALSGGGTTVSISTNTTSASNHTHTYGGRALTITHGFNPRTTSEESGHSHSYQDKSADSVWESLDNTLDSGSHSHDMSHQHSLPDHAHDIDYGIYTSTSATGVTVSINGIDRTSSLGGPFNTDQNDLNIRPYLAVNQWNTIILGSSQLGRIDATVFVQALMGM